VHTGTFNVNDEIMIHCSVLKGSNTNTDNLGSYAIRKISNINNNTIYLDKPITEEFFFSNSTLDKYYIQVIKIPQYRNLTVNTRSYCYL
jgi:hypothetical protein